MPRPNAFITLGEYMQERSQALRGIPREMLEAPFLDMIGMGSKPAYKRILERLVEGLEHDPVGQYTDSRLRNIVAFAQRVEKKDAQLLKRTLKRILEIVEKTDQSNIQWTLGQKAAPFIVDFYNALNEDVKEELAEDVRKILSEESSTMRRLMINLLCRSSIDEESEDKKDLLVFELVCLRRADLERIAESESSEYVKSIALTKIWNEDMSEWEEDLSRIEGPLSAADLIDGKHGSVEHCFRMMDNVDGQEVMALAWERKRNQILKVLEQEPENAGAALAELVELALKKPIAGQVVHEIISVLENALKVSKPKVCGKIAIEFTHIYNAIDDPQLREEIMGRMQNAMEGKAEILLKLLNIVRNTKMFDALLTLSEPKVFETEMASLLCERIGEHIALFESDPEAENALIHLQRVVDLAARNPERTVQYAAKKIAEYPDRAAARKMVEILGQSTCDHTSEDRRDMAIFDIAQPTEGELYYLTEGAVSGHVRMIASGMLEEKHAEVSRASSEKAKQQFAILMRDNPLSAEADNVILKIVTYAIAKRDDGARQLETAISYLEAAMEQSSYPGKEKLVIALATIYENSDAAGKERLVSLAEPLLSKEIGIVKETIINLSENKQTQKALFELTRKLITKGEMNGLLFASSEKVIDKHLNAFVSFPENSGAETLIMKISDEARSRELKLYATGMILEAARNLESINPRNLAFERLASCILEMCSQADEKTRDDLVLFNLRWLRAHSPKLRKSMLRILRLSSCEKDSLDKSELLIFDLVHPEGKELDMLVKKARSGYVRKLAEERKEMEDLVEEQSEKIEDRMGAFESALSEFRALTSRDWSIGDILYMASTCRADINNFAWPKDEEWPTNDLPDNIVNELAVELLRNVRPPGPDRNINALSKAAMKVETQFAKLEETDRRKIKEAVVKDCLEQLALQPFGDTIKPYLENLVSFAGEWGSIDAPMAKRIVTGIIHPLEKIQDDVSLKLAARSVADALIAIIENTKEELKQELISHTAKMLRSPPRAVMECITNILVNTDFEEKDEERVKILFALVDQHSSSLDFFIKNSKSSMAKKIAVRWKHRLKRRVETIAPLDKNEKLVMESILRPQEGFECIMEKNLVEALEDMDPGARHIRLRNFVTSCIYNEDGTVAANWKARLKAAEKAGEGIYSKIGLEEPDAFEKRDALLKYPHLMTEHQQEIVCELAGVRKTRNGVISEVITRAIWQIDPSSTSQLRKWLKSRKNLTNFAGMLYEDRIKPATVLLMDQKEREMISRVIGKLEAEMTEEDVANFIRDILTKDREAFIMLRTSEVDPTVENFRLVAAEMREACDLFDFLGRSILPSSLKENKKGVWKSGGKNDSKENSGTSWTIKKRDGTTSRMDIVFDAIPGQLGFGEAVDIAKEVFEMGMMCGLLENVHDAAVLSCIADLLIACRNHEDVSSGVLQDMKNGRGTSVSFALTEGDVLQTMHVGERKWQVFRNGAKIIEDEPADAHIKIEEDGEGISVWAKKKIQSLFGAQAEERHVASERISLHIDSPDGNVANSGIGRDLFINIDEVMLQTGDVVTLISTEVGNAVPQKTITRTLTNENTEAAVLEIGRMAAEKNGVVIAYRHGT